jgi:hypothetical protein
LSKSCKEVSKNSETGRRRRRRRRRSRRRRRFAVPRPGIGTTLSHLVKILSSSLYGQDCTKS